MSSIFIICLLIALLMGLLFLTLVARKSRQLDNNFEQVRRLREREERIRRNRASQLESDDQAA